MITVIPYIWKKSPHPDVVIPKSSLQRLVLRHDLSLAEAPGVEAGTQLGCVGGELRVCHPPTRRRERRWDTQECWGRVSDSVTRIGEDEGIIVVLPLKIIVRV
jgi:hypothetical protein